VIACWKIGWLDDWMVGWLDGWGLLFVPTTLLPHSNPTFQLCEGAHL
jgi:hypothetical protein